MIGTSPSISNGRASPTGLQRHDFLDALRGTAALYVVIFHMIFIPVPSLSTPYWAKMVASNGGIGVTLFFVVSSFSLFYTMPLRLIERRPWVSFFVHRFFRIAPLFYVWIVLSLLRDELLFGKGHSLEDILLSVTFAFNLTPQGQEGFVWASWTLGIEMLFYALFPLYYLFAVTKHRAICMALALLVAWYAVKALAVYFTSDPKTLEMFSKWGVARHLPVFACGAVAFHFLFGPDRNIEVKRDTGLGLIACALFLFTALLNGWLPNVFGDQYYWQAVLFTCLLIGLGAAPVAPAVNVFTKYLGRVSYSLYLSHPTVIFLLSPTYAKIQSSVQAPSVSFLACMMLTIVSTLVVSEFTYRFIEKPGISLGKRINALIR
ncbi:MAG: acyltransferase [Betaproteobacteria bacterium]|nr:acyltransferase [Betaproteobacteria bacterium]